MCEQQTIDVAYFTKELDALKASLPARTPEELGRYLMRLAAIVIPIEEVQATEIAELKEELAFQIHRNELNETELHEKIQRIQRYRRRERRSITRCMMARVDEKDKELIAEYGHLFNSHGGNDITELIERTDVNFFNNSVVAALQCCCESQLRLLRELDKNGLLVRKEV